jgi:hypothetical protein
MMRPILFPVCVNQRALSGPVVMSDARQLSVGTARNSMTEPVVVRRPIFPPSVNQRAPSGPVVMSVGLDDPVVGTGNSVIAFEAPAATAIPADSTNPCEGVGPARSRLHSSR